MRKFELEAKPIIRHEDISDNERFAEPFYVELFIKINGKFIFKSPNKNSNRKDGWLPAVLGDSLGNGGFGKAVMKLLNDQIFAHIILHDLIIGIDIQKIEKNKLKISIVDGIESKSNDKVSKRGVILIQNEIIPLNEFVEEVIKANEGIYYQLINFDRRLSNEEPHKSHLDHYKNYIEQLKTVWNEKKSEIVG